jgi:hypothetical protein
MMALLRAIRFAGERRRWELPFVCTGAEATVADALAGLAAQLTQHGAQLPDGRDLTPLHLRVFAGRAAAQQALLSTATLPVEWLHEFDVKVVVRVHPHAMRSCCMNCSAC